MNHEIIRLTKAIVTCGDSPDEIECFKKEFDHIEGIAIQNLENAEKQNAKDEKNHASKSIEAGFVEESMEPLLPRKRIEAEPVLLTQVS